MDPDRVHYRWVCACFMGLYLLALPCVLLQRGSAQEADAPDTAASSKPAGNGYSLTGTVVNSVTGEPVRRAAVQIGGQSGRVTLSDDAGHFEFDGLPEGRIFVAAMKPGFSDEQGTSSERTAVQVARDASPVLLKITPAGAIVGRVTTRDEQPLEGFRVHLIAKQNVNGQRAWIDRQFQAATDEDGDFRIPGLPAGTYYVAVDQSQETTLGQRGIANAREQIYARVFYPGVPEFGAATPLELSAGREVEANFSLAPEPVYHVSGGVINQESLTPSLAFARKVGDGDDFNQTVPMQDGAFQAKLPAGSYIVTGSTSNGERLSTPGAVVITSDSPNVHLALIPAASIQVDVQTEHAGGTAERGLVPGMNLQLVSREPFHRPVGWWGAPSGELQNVESGVYTVDINTPGQWWVKSMRCGGVDLLSDDLTVADGVQTAPIEVTLRDDGASVRGTVLPAEDAEQATVLLVQPRGRRNLIKVVRAIRGNFEFQGVTPGDYALLALDNAEQLEYTNPEILNPYLSSAEHVTVHPRGTANVKLSLVTIER
jgi:hypothetical protein